MTAKRAAQLAAKAAGISLAAILLLSFINAQYASAVVNHKMLAPLSLEVKHPVKDLIRERFYRGDMINSYQRNQFSITVLCPHELALLIRQVARGIHLCGLVTGLIRTICGLTTLRASLRESMISILSGATVFGCAIMAPEYIRHLAMWSLGYAPY